MWPIHPIRNKHVALTLSPSALTCSWWDALETEHPELKAYQRIPLTKAEYSDGVIYNPTALKNIIEQFLTTHNLHNSFIHLAINSPRCIERIVTLPHSSPVYTDFQLPELKKCSWNYHYLYPFEHEFAFYVCGLPRELIAQYKLLALTIPLNIIMLTTGHIALFTVYKKLFSSSFRQSQLAADMMQQNHSLHRYFTPEMIYRMIAINKNVALNMKQEYPFIAQSLGLILSQDIFP